jgi:hypothetical protein
MNAPIHTVDDYQLPISSLIVRLVFIHAKVILIYVARFNKYCTTARNAVWSREFMDAGSWCGSRGETYCCKWYFWETVPTTIERA